MMTVGPSYLKHIRLAGDKLARDLWPSHLDAHAVCHHPPQVMLTTSRELEARAILRLRTILRTPMGCRIRILSETRYSSTSCSRCSFLPNEDLQNKLLLR